MEMDGNGPGNSKDKGGVRMIDIKQYLEQTNTVLLAKDAFEHLKERASALDKIRAEIETKYGQCDICEYFEDYDYEENDISEYRPIGDIADILQIIDKYKAESEG